MERHSVDSQSYCMDSYSTLILKAPKSIYSCGTVHACIQCISLHESYPWRFYPSHCKRSSSSSLSIHFGSTWGPQALRHSLNLLTAVSHSETGVKYPTCMFFTGRWICYFLHKLIVKFLCVYTTQLLPQQDGSHLFVPTVSAAHVEKEELCLYISQRLPAARSSLPLPPSYL